MNGTSIDFSRRNDEFVSLTDQELEREINAGMDVIIEMQEALSTDDCRMISSRVRGLEEERRKRIESVLDECSAPEGADISQIIPLLEQ